MHRHPCQQPPTSTSFPRIPTSLTLKRVSYSTYLSTNIILVFKHPYPQTHFIQFTPISTTQTALPLRLFLLLAESTSERYTTFSIPFSLTAVVWSVALTLDPSDTPNTHMHTQRLLRPLEPYTSFVLLATFFCSPYHSYKLFCLTTAGFTPTLKQSGSFFFQKRHTRTLSSPFTFLSKLLLHFLPSHLFIINSQTEFRSTSRSQKDEKLCTSTIMFPSGLHENNGTLTTKYFPYKVPYHFNSDKISEQQIIGN